MDTEDGVISLGSQWFPVSANGYRTVDEAEHWHKIVKDSIYLLVIDASQICFPPVLTQNTIDHITPEMILDTIPLYHNALLDPKYSVTYPSKR